MEKVFENTFFFGKENNCCFVIGNCKKGDFVKLKIHFDLEEIKQSYKILQNYYACNSDIPIEAWEDKNENILKCSYAFNPLIQYKYRWSVEFFLIFDDDYNALKGLEYNCYFNLINKNTFELFEKTETNKKYNFKYNIYFKVKII